MRHSPLIFTMSQKQPQQQQQQQTNKQESVTRIAIQSFIKNQKNSCMIYVPRTVHPHGPSVFNAIETCDFP